MRMRTILALAAVLAVAGCMCKPAPDRIADGNRNTVCIISGKSRFKNEVVAKVTRGLEANGYTVARDNTKNANYYRAADYGAVVYIVDYRMGRTPRHAVRYSEQNAPAQNTVFVITFGNSKTQSTKPIDAITSASVMENADSTANEIMKRLDGILKR